MLHSSILPAANHIGTTPTTLHSSILPAANHIGTTPTTLHTQCPCITPRGYTNFFSTSQYVLHRLIWHVAWHAIMTRYGTSPVWAPTAHSCTYFERNAIFPCLLDLLSLRLFALLSELTCDFLWSHIILLVLFLLFDPLTARLSTVVQWFTQPPPWCINGTNLVNCNVTWTMKYGVFCTTKAT